MQLRSAFMQRILVVLLALIPTPGSAEEVSKPPISDELMRAIEQTALATLSFSEAVRPAIDRSAFDQDSLLDRLNFDKSEIVRFVREDIAFEPYRGVLRGAHGTLLARAGNSVDQSLLLATLLNDAGFEVVIHGGTLPTSEAERLLRVMADRPEARPALNTATIETAQSQWLTSFARLTKVQVSEYGAPAFTMDQVIEGIERDRNDLLAALDKAGVVLGDEEADADLMRETSAYFWVEYRDGPATPWAVAHPAFGKAAAPTVTIAATYAGDIPQELTHRLRLELVVEQRFGTELTTVPLIEPMEFPSANVAGSSLSLTLLPDTLLRTEPVGNDTSLEAETRFLLPLVNKGLATGASALALNGTTVPPELIRLSQTGVFETVAEDFEGAAAALSGLGDPDGEPGDLVAIESVRLLITQIQPGDIERTTERILYQAPGEARLDQKADEKARRVALVAELARSHSLGFASGGLASAYVLDQQLAELEVLEPLIRAWSDPALDECESLDCLPQPELDSDAPGTNVATMVGFFDKEMPLEAGSIVYRDAPNIVRLSRPLFPETSPVPGVFDIMSNPRRAFRLANGRPVSAPDLVLLAGVAETHLERINPGFLGLGSTIERAIGDQSEKQLRAWTGKIPTLTESATIEAAMISNALSAGSIVAMAGHTDDRPIGWWEIDPGSGRTLGMARYGGAAVTETVVLITIMVPATYFLATGAMCSLMPLRRTSPTDRRRQSADFLSCTLCGAVWIAAEVLSDADRRSDAIRSCIDRRGGWSNG